ncbi:MAG: hypothetical protein ACHREM_20105, partial [Polyangiales bacterium]
SEEWRAHCATASAEAKARARAIAARDEVDRLRADVAAQENAILEWQFADAKVRASDAAIDAALADAVAIRMVTLLRERDDEPRLDAIALEVAQAQHRAVEDLNMLGARLGIERRRIDDLRVERQAPSVIYQRIDEIARAKVAAMAPIAQATE